jgi:hypothetical protein
VKRKTTKKKPVNKLVYLAIPLGQAVMCLDCNVVINRHHHTCPRCTGNQFAELANWVKPLCSAEELVAVA